MKIFRKNADLSNLTASLKKVIFHVDSGSGASSEVQALAAPFREISRRLGFRAAAHIAFSHFDRKLCISAGLDEIALSLVRCARLVSCAQSCYLIWPTGEAAEYASVYIDRSEGGEAFARISWAECIKFLAQLPRDSISEWRPPEGSFSRLAFFQQDPPRAVIPITGSHGVRGALIFTSAGEFSLDREHLDVLGEIVSRIRIADRRNERARLFQKMARMDALTGIANRYAFEGQLSGTIIEAKNRKAKIALLYVDIDYFKQANDLIGRANGDLLMKQVVRRIRTNMPSGNVLARVGDDEFAVIEELLPTTQNPTVTARQIIKALSHRFEVNGINVFVGGSVGIAMFPQDGASVADLLRSAELAMYRAKAEGRSRIVYFDQEMEDYERQRATMYCELREALSSGEFVLHYQPLVDLQTGRVTAVETLLRWRHPTRGLLGPATFLPLAEELGLIDSIGTFVLEGACAQHQRWRRDGVPIPRIAVNVSISQMRRSRFVSIVRDIMTITGMPRGALEIEATESAFLQGEKAAQDAMYALAASGVLFTIDDFGTGYSSFANLLRVPAHTIKLDRSFLQDIHPANDRATIIAGMINMAHAMKKEVVAEGIESEEQLSLLVSLGCETGQGYYLCRPGTADQVAAFAMQRPGGISSARIVSPTISAQSPKDPGTPPSVDLEDDNWLTVPLAGC